MPPPSDMPTTVQTERSPRRRRRRWIIAVIVVLVVIFAFLRTFAMFYTDALWFSSVNLHSVWLKMFEIKVGLMVVFSLIFAALLLASLIVAERLAPKGPTLDAEDEFVKRYREVVGPYARWLRAVVVVVLSLIVGSQAIGQWQNWLLFRNSTPFPTTDPEFHRNVAYFVFTLPFEQFLVHWALVALVVVLLVTLVSHYLNGGIRIQGQRPRVRPAVKAHLSVILGLLALVKAVGYYLARFNLDLSSNGYVQGAGYTDVHARLPALDLLILVSFAAAALLIYNIRRQGWALPILGVGLWFLVALTAGTIYPALVQALKVNPSQNTLERPYIQRNINATRTAMGINNVQTKAYPAGSTLTADQLTANSDTLANVRLWDPTQTQPTYQKLQDIRSYYQFQTLTLDRYDINGVETPVVVGVREINQNDLPSSSWVNTTLQYTHGYGMIISPATEAIGNGDPEFSVGGVPPVSNGLPQLTQPSVYFGLSNAPYVVANTKQPEIDYQLPTGGNVETHYTGDGGVQLSNFFDRAMFAVRFNDINLLISNQITTKSRLMFDRGVQQRVTKAAPFLSLDADPYPVLLNGQIDWVQDAYTTTANYPYCAECQHHCRQPGQRLALQQLQLCPELGQGAHQRLHRQDDLLRDGPERSDHPNLREGISRNVHAGVEDEHSAGGPPALPRGHLRRPGNHVRQVPHQTGGQLLQRGRRLDDLAVPRLGFAVRGPCHHPDRQRRGPGGLHRAAGANGAHLPGPSDPRGIEPVVQSDRRVGPVVRGKPDPDALRVHDGRLGPRSLRPAQDVRDAAGKPGQRPRHRCGQDRGHTERLQRHLPAQPERLVRAVGSGPHDPGRQRVALHPAPLRRVLAQRLPRAPTGDRGLRELTGRHREHPRGCVDLVVPGAGVHHTWAVRCESEPSRPRSGLC